jgi:hypothetical protein
MIHFHLPVFTINTSNGDSADDPEQEINEQNLSREGLRSCTIKSGS